MKRVFSAKVNKATHPVGIIYKICRAPWCYLNQQVRLELEMKQVAYFLDHLTSLKLPPMEVI